METNMPETLCMKVMLAGVVALSSIQHSSAQVCGEKYTARQGVITSPGYPDTYENNLNCEYFIRQPSGYQITITFTNFSLEPEEFCDYDFIEVHDGATSSSPLIGKRYCNDTIPPVLRTTQNVMLIHFYTDNVEGDMGFNASYSAECGGYFTASQGVLVSPFYTEQSANNSDCKYLIIQSSGHVISLSFLDVNLGMGDRCNYTYLEIHDGASLTSPLIGDRICNVTFPSSLITTQNALLIHFKKNDSETIRGFKVSYSSAVCGEKYTAKEGVITSPGYPDTYENNLDCEYIIRQPSGYQISITFTDFSLEPEEICAYDFVEIHDGATSSSPLIGDRYCNDIIPPVLRTTQNVMLIHFYTDDTEGDIGFNASYSAVCGEIYTAKEGVITSPGFPDTYENNLDCEYIIRQPSGYQISITFTDFSLEPEEICDYDFIEIHDGATSSSPLIGDRYCNDTIPPVLRTTQNVMLIHFYTDNVEGDMGFNASYSAVCGEKYTAKEGVITSPGYPDMYDNNLDCEYFIRQPSGYQISITFTYFSLEHHKFCAYDFVEIFDGAISSFPLIGKRYCNNTIPPVLRTTQNVMLIRFRTDSTVRHRGFFASYRTECGGYFTASQGVLVSPFYTEQSANNSDCKYLIIQSSGHVISLSFLDVNLGMGDRCNYTYLEIHDGASLTSPLIGDRICNVTFPSFLITTQNAMLIHFKKNDSETIRGFKVSYSSAACDVNLTKSHGELVSPFYPNTFENNWDCMYIIRQPKGHIIELSLFDFDMALEAACTNTLQIYDGENLTSPLLVDQFCKVTLPMTLRSTQQAMLIHFKRNRTEIYGGFNASYNTGVCHGNFTKKQGIIASPFYPDTYGNHDCVFIISRPAGHLIELSFFDLDLGENTPCNSSFIEVHDGMSLTSPLLGDRLCPGALPRTLRSTQNFMLIHMKTNGSLELRGFNASYRISVCEGNFTSPQGMIILLTDVLMDFRDLECVYIISQPLGYIIKLSFSDLVTGQPYMDDFLTIVDVGPSNSSKRHEWRCSKLPVLETSTYNIIQIRFKLRCLLSYVKNNITYNISYTSEPTISSPTIYGYKTGDVLQTEGSLTMTCIVEGRKPLVDSVIFSCPGHTDSPDFEGPGGVISMLSINHLKASDNGSICVCTSVWMHETWEKLNETIMLLVNGSEQISFPSSTFSSMNWTVAGCTIAIILIVITIILVKRFCIQKIIYNRPFYERNMQTTPHDHYYTINQEVFTQNGCDHRDSEIYHEIDFVPDLPHQDDDVIIADHHQPCRKNDDYTDDYLISSGYLQPMDTCGSNTRPASSNYETPLKTEYLQPIFTIDSQTTTSILEGDHSSTDRPCSQQKEE